MRKTILLWVLGPLMASACASSHVERAEPEPVVPDCTDGGVDLEWTSDWTPYFGRLGGERGAMVTRPDDGFYVVRSAGSRSHHVERIDPLGAVSVIATRSRFGEPFISGDGVGVADWSDGTLTVEPHLNADAQRLVLRTERLEGIAGHDRGGFVLLTAGPDAPPTYAIYNEVGQVEHPPEPPVPNLWPRSIYPDPDGPPLVVFQVDYHGALYVAVAGQPAEPLSPPDCDLIRYDFLPLVGDAFVWAATCEGNDGDRHPGRAFVEVVGPGVGRARVALEPERIRTVDLGMGPDGTILLLTAFRNMAGSPVRFCFRALSPDTLDLVESAAVDLDEPVLVSNLQLSAFTIDGVFALRVERWIPDGGNDQRMSLGRFVQR